MSLWEVDVTQTDCPHILTTKKYPSLRIIVMGTELTGRYERLFSVFSASTTRELNSSLNFFQKDDRVKNFKLLSRESGVATALYLMSRTSMFQKTTEIGLRIHPLVARGGKEKWYLISGESGVNIRTMISDQFTKVISMKRKRSAEIFRSFYTSVRDLLPALSISDKFSKREIEILRVAQEKGFFSWPRKTNLTNLSKELEMPKSTLSYHFRAMEKKMVDALS
jgi:predicted DNA binding protein